MSERDRAPIDQQWIQHYCDEFLTIAVKMDNGVMKDALLRRVECAMDLLEAWQTRNTQSINGRKGEDERAGRALESDCDGS